ncbi:biotin/lipoyl-binding protein, partial [Microbacteriaceae bacterium K1510]|nr:biotin/lipoyl-binding protein [Microbacteriaceae bacterium K1510]
CSSKQAANPAKTEGETKKVVVESVKKGQSVKLSELSGTLQPNEEAQVSFEVAGRVVELNRNEGDQVKQGEIIGRIDSSDYSLQLAKANTSVEQTGANLQKVNNGAREQERIQAKALQDKAQLAYQKASDDYKKYEKLYK